jgi:imidazolonepropionase-like amidohydrolase
MPVATHMFYRDDASRLLEMGTSLLAHSIRDQAIDEAFIEELSDAGVCYVPTLTREVSTFVYAERPKFFDDPFFLEFADPDEMARVSDPAFMTRMADDEFTPRYREAWLQAMENLRTLSDANVPIAFGTDSGPGGRFPGFFEHMELEMMVMAGMSAEQALMSATLDAADCLGLDDVGTLEPGKWADFLVLGADPVADIAATRTLQRVYIAGNEVTR